MKRHGPWRTLGLDPTEDRSAIRRAYADKLRGFDVDKDIEGYTRLRQARDHALLLAKGLAEAQSDEDEADYWVDDDFPIGDLESDYAAYGEVLERTEATDRLAQPEAGDTTAEPAPQQVLLAILYPGGETSEQPLTADEWKLAQGALGAILQEAEASSIDTHAAIDGWLAHHLASTWPRSAWLLEPAAEAFGWMDESGRLTERPAVRFLNLRLRGLRFVTMVEQPGHALHKAWIELAKPGPKGAFAFLRTSKGNVRRLLVGIRERYPEVESYLDPQRVASWETAIEGTPWTPWKVVFRIIWVAVVLSQFGRFFFGSFDEPAAPPDPIDVAWSADQVDQVVIELFGERLNDDTLRKEAPDLWGRMDRMSGWGGSMANVVPDTSRELLVLLREQSQLAARDARFDELVAIKQVKLALLRLAREQRGADDCLDFAAQARLSTNVDVPEAVRAEERALAARLAAANLLLPSDSRLPKTAAIPGSVIDQMIDSTGLPEETVRGAIRGEGNEEVLCNSRIALLEVVLKRPADVTADLLRIM